MLRDAATVAVAVFRLILHLPPDVCLGRFLLEREIADRELLDAISDEDIYSGAVYGWLRRALPFVDLDVRLPHDRAHEQAIECPASFRSDPGWHPPEENVAGEYAMPMAGVNGVALYWEETRQSTPLVWIHEYGSDVRSWEPQVRYFSRQYRVFTYNQRGYRPSTVPSAAHDCSRALLVEDLHQLRTHLGRDQCTSAGAR